MKATKEEPGKEKEEIEGEGEPVKKNNKKKLIIIVAAALILLASIGAGLYFTGIFPKKSTSSSDHSTEKNASGDNSTDNKKSDGASQKLVFFNLDEFIVNLSKIGGQPSFLKMSITLELESESIIQQIGEQMPLIRDTFQVYLRELRADDLQGSAGIFRLRQELLLRLNKIIYPIKVNNILFREILVQ